ncbi:MAG TPA: DUF4369 domain-containing protein, partial [Pontibacter sp.]
MTFRIIKNTTLAVVSLLSVAACTSLPKNKVQEQEEYTITGKIDGNADGMKVYLQTTEWPVAKTVDSTVIKKGEFKFKGSVAVPAKHSIIIDATPKDKKSSERYWLRSTFYLENSPIEYIGHVDSLPSYYYNRKRVTAGPVIKGSATEDESKAFSASLGDVRKQLAATNEEYLAVYHVPAMEGKFNTAEGIALVRKEQQLKEELEKRKWQYIKDNPKSVVAYDQAMYYLHDMFVNL